MTEHIKNPFFWIAHISPIWASVAFVLIYRMVLYFAGGHMEDFDLVAVTMFSMFMSWIVTAILAAIYWSPMA